MTHSRWVSISSFPGSNWTLRRRVYFVCVSFTQKHFTTLVVFFFLILFISILLHSTTTSLTCACCVMQCLSKFFWTTQPTIQTKPKAKFTSKMKEVITLDAQYGLDTVCKLFATTCLWKLSTSIEYLFYFNEAEWGSAIYARDFLTHLSLNNLNLFYINFNSKVIYASLNSHVVVVVVRVSVSRDEGQMEALLCGSFFFKEIFNHTVQIICRI